MNREFLLVSVIESSALFLAVWIAFRALPSIPPSWKAWIWRLAFLKPLASFLPFAAVTLHILPASNAEKPLQASITTLHATHGVYSTGLQAALVHQVPTFSLDPLVALWVLGAGTVLALGFRDRLRAEQIAKLAQPINNPPLREAFEKLANGAGITHPVRLLCSPTVEGAMLIGSRQPTIVLPSSAVNPDSYADARLMLAHEVAHLRRRDLSWFAAIWVVQSLFFFNPVVWLAARCARKDHESATDRYAAELASTPIQTYAEMLLRAMVVSRKTLVPGALSMAGSFRNIHQRLEAMKHFNRRPSLLLKSATIALVLATASLIPTYVPAAVAAQGESLKQDSNWVDVSDSSTAYSISLKFVRYDIRSALKLLFAHAHKTYLMDAHVRGTLTVSLQNVSFETALQNLLRQVDCSYRVRQGNYEIYPLPPSQNPSPLRGATATMHPGDDGQNPANISFQYERYDIRSALRGLFKLTHKSYSIDPKLQGTVTLSVHNVTFDTALQNLLRQVDGSYRITDGVYVISPRTAKENAGPP